MILEPDHVTYTYITLILYLQLTNFCLCSAQTVMAAKFDSFDLQTSHRCDSLVTFDLCLVHLQYFDGDLSYFSLDQHFTIDLFVNGVDTIRAQWGSLGRPIVTVPILSQNLGLS